ncbi:glycosyltransferase family 4 protein [Alicyclobacillus fastidiosus]|uniref:Glycosyltransferase family 4 protein n=1 Tax=Alicyclobacillus fastidiosus TaxID=392011 RepID=A0ABY6ZAI7_9BACL|nr:glycosyltransferase family 1 protein [Alicyclobacillus fastidiosus]WAH39889.1 glycosyltransferase family 4 protein [Alicyclobacillus fastidiosus]GMA61160.1 hypothetical protein GCM10025859_16000 [Alicyclobacillus fastidiosus]
MSTSVRVALDCSLSRGGLGRGGNRFARAVEAAVDLLCCHASFNQTIDVVKFDLVHWQRKADEGGSPVRMSRLPGPVKRALWDKGTGWRLGALGTRFIGLPDVVHTVEFRLVQLAGSRSIYSLFDLPWIRGASHAEGLRATIESSLQRADVVLAVSECTKDDAMTWGLPESRIRQIYPAIEPVYLESPKKPRPASITGDFLLFVGSCGSPNKNFKRLLLALAESYLDIPLVVVGPHDPSPYLHEVHVHVPVVYLGHVSEETLLSLYDHATALLFPSLFEGFGYPIVEAMARGCPVLTSNIEVIREVANDAAVFVNPLEIDDMIRGLLEITDHSVINPLILRGRKQATNFSLQRLASSLLSVYTE